MRAFIFLLFVSFFACNATPATDVSSGAAGTNTSTNTTANTSPSNNNSEIIPISENLEKPDIKVTVEGITSGTAYVIGIFNGQNFKQDSAVFQANGQVHFKNDTPYNPGLYFLLLPSNQNFQMLIDEDQTFEMTTKKSGLVNDMVVKGNKETELLYENLKFEASLQPQISALSGQIKPLAKDGAEYKKLQAERDALLAKRKATLQAMFDKHPKSFFTSFKRAGQNPDIRPIMLPDGTPDNNAQVYHYRRDFWNGVNFGDQRLMRTPVIFNKLKRYMTELTPQNHDSIIVSAKYLVDQSLEYPEYFKYFANSITMQYDPEKSTLMDPQAVYVFMLQNYFTNERAFWSDSVQTFALQQRAYEMQASLLGKKAKNVTAKGPDGKTYSLYDINADYIVVYMFNPDCDQCQIQTPQLIQMYPSLKARNVEVFGIALDTEDQIWKDYIKKNNITWTNVHDPTNRAVYPNYFVDHTPEIYLLDKDKIFVAKNLNVNQINEVLAQKGL